jgi:activating signal cointegrator complex subunit 3
MIRPWLSDHVPPRVTGVLRLLHSENQQPVNVQELWLKRRSVLKSRYEAEQREENCTPNGLTWDVFVHGKECSSRMNRIMRSVFKDMVGVMHEMIGDDIVGEELQEAVLILYNKAIKTNIVALWARKDIPSDMVAQFGKLEPSLWGKVCVLAAKLHKWRGELDLGASKEVKKGPADEALEYGNGFLFDDEMFQSIHEDVSLAELSGMIDLPFDASIEQGCVPAKSDPGSTEGGGSKVSAGWLLSLCENHIRQVSALGGSTGFNSEELSKMIITCLASSNPESQIQGDLFNLLGEHGFSMLQELFEKRSEIIKNVKEHDFASPAAHGFVTDNISSQFRDSNGFVPRQSTATVAPGLNISVRTDADKKAAKSYKREMRRLQRSGLSEKDAAAILAPDAHSAAGNDGLADNGFDPAFLSEQRALGLQGGSARPIPQSREIDLGAAMKSQQSLQGLRSLPSGTKREKFKGWEEVFVPAPTMEGLEKNPTLVPISEFPDWAQLAFKGVKSLNRMQSQVYRTAFHSAENMLVCAPTGAGKTNVAMMTVLQTIGNNMVNGVIQKEDLKIIFVAPMKALAQEVVSKFGKQLAPLGLQVRELTGDMQMTKREIAMTQMIVTTPEKWDVVTRKGGLDGSLSSQVKLLIIDEVHLLADDRGSVIETLVARTLRQVETLQSMIRIVGLSATLPNYMDVGAFLRVNVATGLFYFDGRWRPVPLETRYIGVSVSGQSAQRAKMNEIAYMKAIESIKKGNQVMIFVHSRKGTVKTGHAIADFARKHGTTGLLDCTLTGAGMDLAKKKLSKSRNGDMRELFGFGIGIHHAGMLRSDRNLMESCFSKGLTKILCCTATLAWGVNLPAHTVCIKGTEIYDAEKGGMKELGVLDVQQIFGRAGRPQFDTSGEGIIITSHAMLNRYLSMMTRQAPIESQFTASIVDNLNAEIAGGTVTSVSEAVTWLSYTYLFVRMMRNPMAYGISYEEKHMDHRLVRRRTELIQSAARQLDDARMARYDAKSGNLAITSLGRVASHFYLKHETIIEFNKKLSPHLAMKDVLDLICSAEELDNVRVRDEELKELDMIKAKAPFAIKGGIENKNGKCNALLQGYISRIYPRSFTLVSDTHYVAQNAARVTRGLFEICLKRGWPGLSETFLTLSKAIDKRTWWEPICHPLRQFEKLPMELVRKLEERDVPMSKLYDFSAQQLGQLVRYKRMGDKLLDYIRQFPALDIQVKLLPITRTILKVELEIYPDFIWSDRNHGNIQPWYIWMEDSENDRIYHSEYLMITKKQYLSEEPIQMVFTVPIFEPLPAQYYIRAESDRWIGASHVIAASFQHLILPDHRSPYTDLMDLQPLSIKALQNSDFQSLFSWTHFNPIQTQIFPTVYHTNRNILLGAPTGSGKTVVAELAMMKLWRERPGAKVVYIAPLKALARERHSDWRRKYGPTSRVRRQVVQLTGDVTPDMQSLKNSHIIITTPEKWDGVSRSWHRRSYVKQVELVIIDEIHLLGEDRGPVLEAVVSRMRNISTQLENPIRLVGLSTALANAHDLGSWMGIRKVGLYNFRPSVRPVPLEVHISGFPGRHYCPRMATMNKPTYISIKTYSPDKPTLVFVSSRRQTRLTALDLISLCAAEENPRQFLRIAEDEIDILSQTCRDKALQDTLPFGIGIHHGGLCSQDREIVEKLFLEGHIQVLVCTSTLAWGVNFPAHLVVIKGTEYFDGKLGRYVDFAITDILQMMGRAGRPQFDKDAVACVLIHEPKKEFYKKFLYEPFPVESKLLHGDVLHNHVNAEISGGVIASLKDTVEYLTWTYMFRRILKNPSFYGLDDASDDTVEKFLLDLCKLVLRDLKDSGCIEASGSLEDIGPLPLGKIASYYYISYRTVFCFYDRITEWNRPTQKDVFRLLSDAIEYDELPVRHNEDKLNVELAKFCTWSIDEDMAGDPHVKCFLLLQAHHFRIKLPMSDYITDLKSVMDQAFRITSAMVDISAYVGNLTATTEAIMLAQNLKRISKNGRERPSIDLDIALFDHPGSTEIPEGQNLVLDNVYKLRVDMFAKALPPKQKGSSRRATWWVILGEKSSNTIFSIKRFSFGNRHIVKQELEFSFDILGTKVLTCFLMSDNLPGIPVEKEFVKGVVSDCLKV